MSWQSTLTEAQRLHTAGFSVIPIKLDGTKAPDLRSWKQYKHVRPTKEQVNEWFSYANRGLGVIGGQVSDGAEFLDFDNHKDNGCMFDEWTSTIPKDVL